MADETKTSARNNFLTAVAAVAEGIGDKPLDPELEDWLNKHYPASEIEFQNLAGLIARGAKEGWLCEREAAGIRFGRPVKPGAEAGRFSVDVVLMDAVRGPYHRHPTGEIGMIVPVSGEPRFDGKGPGWYVYGPGSGHYPTVTGGCAFVLYLLPEGAIDFTQPS